MMLIDDRAPPPPPAESLPPWEPNWRVWWRVALAVALGAAAIWTSGLAEVIAAFGALLAACSAATAAIPYSGGLREWRQ
jgi:hypothetical protein